MRSGTPAHGPLPAPAPGEPPVVLTRVEQLVREGKDAEAILLAYRTAEEDVRRAFAMKLPSQWTHRDFLAKYLRNDMGAIRTLLPRLYVLFEPVRYGEGQGASAKALLPILRSIYLEPALRSLPYLAPSAASAPSPKAAPSPRGR